MNDPEVAHAVIGVGLGFAMVLGMILVMLLISWAQHRETMWRIKEKETRNKVKEKP